MFLLPKLPYAYDALEPYIDAQTLDIHYNKHHAGYVDKTNKALEDYPDLGTQSIEDLLKTVATLPEPLQTKIRNFGGGHYNHTFFWSLLTKNGDNPHGGLAQAINNTYGSFEVFKKQFSQAALDLFGSGWAWLCRDINGNLIITTTNNQECPLSKGLIPVLTLDVWEHAYYLNYKNERTKFIDAWWHIINWQQAEDYFKKSM